jgi:hypothetical protein
MRAAIVLVALASACSNDSVSSAADARRAYLGLDGAVDKALNLGMKGYNEAHSANIPAEFTGGDVSGTLTVTGQVDQGASDNKEMRLQTALVGYQDVVPGSETDGGLDGGTAIGIVYDTDPAALPALDLSLRNIPNGTFTGTLNGSVRMSGGLKGSVALALTLSGDIEAVPSTSQIRRVAGTTHITGTATSDYGTYAVDVTR